MPKPKPVPYHDEDFVAEMREVLEEPFYNERPAVKTQFPGWMIHNVYAKFSTEENAKGWTSYKGNVSMNIKLIRLRQPHQYCIKLVSFNIYEQQQMRTRFQGHVDEIRLSTNRMARQRDNIIVAMWTAKEDQQQRPRGQPGDIPHPPYLCDACKAHKCR